MAPLYYCLVRKDNVVTTYVSTDGLTFTAAGTGNMECAEGSSCTVSDSTSYSLTPSALTFFVCSENDVEGEETSFTYRYMRFNVTDIEGSASDCPEL